ncbi:MAG: sugar ABC transporter substrate-binding protein [Clostridiales bacterium]|nr:sugar ABC transporter substrate-binding protein [Clostridiales bacterium]
MINVLKSRWFLLILVACGLLLCGCGKEKQAGVQSDVVEVRFGWPGGHFEFMQNEVIPWFERENPDIKIQFEYQPWNQFFTKLKTQIAAGEAPDFWLSDGVYVMEFADRGALLELTEWVKRDLDPSQYFALDFTEDPDGKLWGVPRELQPIAFYYNKKLFDEAGLKYPDETWDWNTLLEYSKKLTKPKGRQQQYGFESRNWISAGWFNFIYQNEGKVLDETKTKSMLNQPEAIEAVEFMVDLIYKHKVSPPPDVSQSQGGQLFQAEIVAMMYNNYATIAALNQVKELDYDVTILPKGRIRAAGYNTCPFVISAKTSKEKAEAAWKFIKFFVSNKEIQKKISEYGIGVPIMREVIYSDAFVGLKDRPHNREAFIEPLESGYALPMDLNKCWNEWRTALTDDLSLAWLGKMSTKDAMLKAHKDVQKILDRAFSDE